LIRPAQEERTFDGDDTVARGRTEHNVRLITKVTHHIRDGLGLKGTLAVRYARTIRQQAHLDDKILDLLLRMTECFPENKIKYRGKSDALKLLHSSLDSIDATRARHSLEIPTSLNQAIK